MRVVWRRPLPRGTFSAADLDGPLAIDGGRLIVGGDGVVYEVDLRRDRVRSTRVRRSGLAWGRTLFRAPHTPHLHAGWFHRVGKRLDPLDWGNVRSAGHVGLGPDAPLVDRDRIVYTDVGKQRLVCRDHAGALRWSLDLSVRGRATRYMVGPVARKGEDLICYGRGALCFIDPARGTIRRTFVLPGGGKPFPPAGEGDALFFGFASGGRGGVVRTNANLEIEWTFTKRGSSGSPEYIREVWAFDDVVVYPHGETQLVGLAAATGKELWTARPGFLWMRPERVGRDLLVGTRDGDDGAVLHLFSPRGRGVHHGRAYFSFRNEVLYPARADDALFAGDLDGVLHRVRLRDLKVEQRLTVGGALRGRILVDGDRLYTLSERDGAAEAVCVAL